MGRILQYWSVMELACLVFDWRAVKLTISQSMTTNNIDLYIFFYQSLHPMGSQFIGEIVVCGFSFYLPSLPHIPSHHDQLISNLIKTATTTLYLHQIQLYLPQIPLYLANHIS